MHLDLLKIKLTVPLRNNMTDKTSDLIKFRAFSV